MSKLFYKQSKKKKSDEKRRATIAEDRKHILTPHSGFYIREAYKTLRTNVNFALADAEGCKVILVTSAMQSEGKSLTALNLAISLAMFYSPPTLLLMGMLQVFEQLVHG